MIEDRELKKLNQSGEDDSALPKVTMILSRVLDDAGFRQWTIERLGASCSSFRWNMSYANKEPLTEVVRPEVVDALAEYLPNSDETHVLTAFEFKLELPNLILNRLTVTGLGVRDGIQHVTVSFQRVLGVLHGLFRKNRAPDFLKEAECQVSTRVLIDLLVPVLNLLEAAPDTTSSLSQRQLNAFLVRLQSRHHELAYYLAMLTRYVANAQRLPVDPPGLGAMPLRELPGTAGYTPVARLG